MEKAMRTAHLGRLHRETESELGFKCIACSALDKTFLALSHTSFVTLSKLYLLIYKMD